MPKAKTIQFLLDGKPLIIGGPPPMANRIREAAEAIPDGEFLTTEQLAASMGHSRSGIKDHGNSEQLAEVSMKISMGSAKKRIFGNPRSIAMLRGQLEATKAERSSNGHTEVTRSRS